MVFKFHRGIDCKILRYKDSNKWVKEFPFWKDWEYGMIDQLWLDKDTYLIEAYGLDSYYKRTFKASRKEAKMYRTYKKLSNL